MSPGSFEETIRADAMKFCRGWILRLLSKFQLQATRETNDQVLQGALQVVGHQVSMPVLHAQIRYLAEKGYVELKQPVPDVPVVTCWITAKGMDLYEGSIEDVGVLFDNED